MLTGSLIPRLSHTATGCELFDKLNSHDATDFGQELDWKAGNTRDVCTNIRVVSGDSQS